MEAPSEGSYSRTSVQNIILVFLVLISCFLYSGLIFGWAPFVLLLKEEGFFTSDCSPSETICASQANQFNFIYTLASTTVSITGLPAGIILDNFGPLVTTCIAGMFECTGLVLIAISNTEGEVVVAGITIPHAFTSAIIVLAIGGALFMFAAFHASFTWPEQQAFVMAAISCLFDGSTFTFAAVYFIHTLGFSRSIIFTTFAIFTVFFTGSLFLAWSFYKPHVPHLMSSNDQLDQMSYSNNQESLTQPLLRDSPKTGGSSPESCHEHSFNFRHEQDIEASETSLEEGTINPMHFRTFRSQLCSFHFLFVFCLSTVHVVRSNFFLGTVNLLLENLGDASNGYEVTEAVGYIIPCGFLAIPIIGLSVTLFGSLLTFQFINLMGMIYGAMSVVKILKLQLATAAVYTIYRAFFFSTLSTYNAEIFGKRTLGRIQGILFLVSGLLNLCIIPVVKFTTTTLNGDLFWPNLSQLFFLVPLMILTEVERFRR